MLFCENCLKHKWNFTHLFVVGYSQTIRTTPEIENAMTLFLVSFLDAARAYVGPCIQINQDKQIETYENPGPDMRQLQRWGVESSCGEGTEDSDQSRRGRRSSTWTLTICNIQGKTVTMVSPWSRKSGRCLGSQSLVLKNIQKNVYKVMQTQVLFLFFKKRSRMHLQLVQK